MRFAITAVDRFRGVFEAFLHAGWEPVKLFTAPARSTMGMQSGVISLAEEKKAAIQLSRMTENDMRGLQNLGCEALILASYDWKIPDWRPYLQYAANFHPSPLPEGRGPYPLVRALLDRHSAWGVTCHRVTPEIDGGEILDAQYFRIQADETHDTLNLKTQMAAKKLAMRVASQFVPLWEQARPQPTAPYWPRWSIRDQLINFDQPTADILHRIRAFGQVETLGYLNGTLIVIRQAGGWLEPHEHLPGTLVHTAGAHAVMAAADGYIALLDWNVAPPDVLAELQAAAG
jgi:methionyl-tRNA formyltransferase